MRSFIINLIVFSTLVVGHAGAAIAPVQIETKRFALIISDNATGPSMELATVLQDQYGFTVAAFVGSDANPRNIENGLYELAVRIGPYDQVFVHISLPVVRVPELYYLPPNSNPENRWEHVSWAMIQSWIFEVSTGPLLITYPSCAPANRSAYEDATLEELAYRAGKRRFPIELMMVCDVESLRTWRRDPEMGFVNWRSEQVSELLAQLLSGTVRTRSVNYLDVEALDGAGIIRALLQYEDEGLRLDYLTIPLHQEGAFRFVPLEAGNAYEARYANAGSYEALTEIQRDYLEASSESAALKSPFIVFSRKVALSPRAAAPDALDLQPSDILQLRRNAGAALMLRSEDLAARNAIVDIVQEADSGVMRRTAVVNLSKMGESARPKEIQALKNAMEDEDPFVRNAAVLGLAQTEAPGTPDFLAAAFQGEPDPRVKRSMILILASFARQQDTLLYMTALEDQDPGVRSQAVAALSALPPSVTVNQALVEHLGQDRHAGVRTTIAYALSQTSPVADRSGNIEILVAGLLSGDAPEVRVAMAKSLGQLGGNDAEAALRSTLAGENPTSVLIACARALGVMASMVAVPELEAAADSDDPMLRVSAIEALGKIRTKPAAEVIWIKLEQDEDLRVQQAALRALESMPVDPASIRQRLDSPSVQVRQAAVAQVANSDDPKMFNLLLEALDDRDTTVQQTSIAGLSKRPLATDQDTVRNVLESGNTQTQVNLINVLGLMPREEAHWVEEPLAQASTSDSPEVRAAAIRALGSAGDTQQLEAILSASEDSHALVRESAARALGNFDSEPATLRLEQLAKQDRNEGVRRVAIDALSISLSKKRMKFKPHSLAFDQADNLLYILSESEVWTLSTVDGKYRAVRKLPSVLGAYMDLCILSTSQSRWLAIIQSRDSFDRQQSKLVLIPIGTQTHRKSVVDFDMSNAQERTARGDVYSSIACDSKNQRVLISDSFDNNIKSAQVKNGKLKGPKSFYRPISARSLSSVSVPFSYPASAEREVNWFYVGDSQHNSVYLVNLSTDEKEEIFSGIVPGGIFVTPDNSMLVADPAKERIMEYNFNTRESNLRVKSREFQDPSDVAIDAEGHLWIADPKARAVFEFTDGKETPFLHRP